MPELLPRVPCPRRQLVCLCGAVYCHCACGLPHTVTRLPRCRQCAEPVPGDED